MQILSRLFHETSAESERRDDELDALVMRVLRINPCLRRARGHEERLRTALAWCVGFLGEVTNAMALSRVMSRKEIVDRLVDQLAIEALRSIVKEADRRHMLDCERALLADRIEILQRMGIGTSSTAGDGPRDPTRQTPIDARLDRSDLELRGLGLLSDAFDDQLDRFCNVFFRPDAHIHAGAKQVHLRQTAAHA
ncbi:hypothetical protein WKW77_19120 [Variovorax ureilyticus]|uniref:Uncharacterized protein n=1 Tax=Variovorax ureilyticus TaxID=1836198 RepID=A0ABU8VIA7_9BURK